MPEISIGYVFWVIMLLSGSTIAWATNFFSLPGNWFIVGLAALFVVAMDSGNQAAGLNWEAVAIVGLMAAGGEAVEFVAGAAGAAKQGGSRRAVALALLGTFVGSIAGAVMGVPIPLIGPLIGALAGAAAGAFLGAYLGEMWKHGLSEKSFEVGVGAAVGRVLGTMGKLLIGAVMIVVLAVRAFGG